MAEENVLTDLDAALKTSLGTFVTVGGQPVPVRMVMPDADFVELELPCVTLQLVDVREGVARTDNERVVEKDEVAKEATIRPPETPFDLHFVAAGHTERTRSDRLLLGLLMQWVKDHAILQGASGRTYYLARDLAFRDTGRERAYARGLAFVVKARLPSTLEEIVPLVVETRTEVEELGGG